MATERVRRRALSATMQLYDNLSQFAETLPLLQLLTASVDNLRLRAERLAPQLAQVRGLDLPKRSQLRMRWAAGGFADVALPSSAVALSVTDDDPIELEKRLRSVTRARCSAASDGSAIGARFAHRVSATGSADC